MSILLASLKAWLPTVVKAYLAYQGVAHKELAEFPLKAFELLAGKKLEEIKAKSVYEKIETQIRSEFDTDRFNALTEEQINEAFALAGTALIGDHSFELLFDHLFDPTRLQQNIREKVKGLPTEDSSLQVRLFDHILLATCNALAANLDELPGFRNWFYSEVHKRFKRNDERLKALEKSVSDKIYKQILFEAHYRQELATQLDKVELFIRLDDLKEEDTEQQLSVAYVNLQIQHKSDSEEGPTVIRASELLARCDGKSNRFLVLGEAGSGKTTFLRWLGLKAVTRAIEEFDSTAMRKPEWVIDLKQSSRDQWEDRIPIFLRLRDVTEKTWPTPEKMLASVQLNEDPPKGWVKNVLEQGRALLLVDGLDEVETLRRESAMEWIGDRLCKAYPDNIFVVSSRPQAVEKDLLAPSGFIRCEVRPLGKDDRVECVKAWHTAVALKTTDRRNLTPELEHLQRRILDEFEKNPATAQLASIPLLCSLLCALNRSSKSGLPSKLSELCERAIQMLVGDLDELRDICQKQDIAEYQSASIDQRRKVARALAYTAVLDPKSRLIFNEALKVIRDAHGIRPPDDDNQAKQMLEGLRLRGNLVRNAESNHVEFAHNSLRDYLAGIQFADDNLYDQLIEELRQSDRAKWEPVVRMSCFLRDRDRFREKVLAELLNDPDSDCQQLISDFRLAWSIRNELNVNLPIGLQDRFDKVGRDCYGIPSFGDGSPWSPTTPLQAELVAYHGESAVEWLGWQDGLDEELGVACVRALASIATRKAHEALLSHLKSTRHDPVLEALADALGYEEFSSYRDVLELTSVSIAISTPNSDVHPAATLINSDSLKYMSLSSDVLELNNSQVSDVSYLSSLTSLQSLRLDKTKVSDVTPLADLTSLGRLDLDYTYVSDVSSLSRLTSLQLLYLNNTEVSDVSALSELTSLEWLFLHNTQVSDVSPLSNLTFLEELHLHTTAVSDVGPLAGLTSLQRLDLSNTQVNDLSPLSGLTSLQRLDLACTRISDLTPLSGLTSLRELTLENTPVSNVSPLSGLTSLRNLHLHNTQVSAEDVKVLRQRLPNCRIIWGRIE